MDCSQEGMDIFALQFALLDTKMSSPSVHEYLELGADCEFKYISDVKYDGAKFIITTNDAATKVINAFLLTEKFSVLI